MEIQMHTNCPHPPHSQGKMSIRSKQECSFTATVILHINCGARCIKLCFKTKLCVRTKVEICISASLVMLKKSYRSILCALALPQLVTNALKELFAYKQLCRLHQTQFHQIPLARSSNSANSACLMHSH